MSEISPVILQTTCKIRHEFTNYERLATFYTVQKSYRKKLNRVIYRLIADKITIEEFHKQVKQIESEVELTRKPNQKRFLHTKIQYMMQTGFYTQAQARAIATKNLQEALQVHRSYYTGKYRYDRRESFSTHVSNRRS